MQTIGYTVETKIKKYAPWLAIFMFLIFLIILAIKSEGCTYEQSIENKYRNCLYKCEYSLHTPSYEQMCIDKCKEIYTINEASNEQKQ
jgi:hypothetical protein